MDGDAENTVYVIFISNKQYIKQYLFQYTTLPLTQEHDIVFHYGNARKYNKTRGLDYLLNAFHKIINKYSCERSQSSMGALYYDTQSFYIAYSSLLPQYYNLHRRENNIIARLSD